MKKGKNKANRKNAQKFAFFALAGIILLTAIFLSVNEPSVTGNVARNSQFANTIHSLADDDAILGNVRAPVTIVQFTDMQCPFCRRFETETFPLIKADYIDTGKVKFVTRDFPIESIHQSSLIAALALECIREKGRARAYYALKEAIILKQNERDGGAQAQATKIVSFTENDLVKWASSLGYSIETCLKNRKYKSEVEKDISDGQAAGIRGTPSFFIINSEGTSTLVSGAQPYASFKTALDNALK